MGKVVIDVSMSLDGYLAGRDVSPAQPMGERGEVLHRWLFDSADAVAARLGRELRDGAGAVVLGRRTFEVGIGEWRDTPFPLPSFVVTRAPRERLPMRSASFEFVSDGALAALRRAQEAAEERDVLVMGGELSRSLLAAGAVDELNLHLVPVALGAGVRLFDEGFAGARLECTGMVESAGVVHLRYRIRRG
ncbi:dihydrofolate reductase family protein [Lysobacter sp. K5869]|uniref:dihydrofolate reductase family protein n=1 Tax=Lysobacter sp. K5869 TaxID=2820808 RepID=UPI001C05F2FB|nr:dihydrofolate reductase family protein [Lysobacter sp. K5869]QWP75153.1 dihydrofolate reductase family protein [Lysobacter sp. K5869]